VPSDYVWGAALPTLDAFEPHARIVNLETAVTTSPDPWPGKDILYRTHPANVAILRAARIDCCVLANNHVFDWGEGGLRETLDVLQDAGLATAGAGRDLAEAEAPAIVDTPAGRVIVVAFASTTSGTPIAWAAQPGRAGVAVMDEDSGLPQAVAGIGAMRRPGDLVVASIHWGSNWGYDVTEGQRRLAHQLIEGGVDLVHGHSSHHPRPIERHRGRLILYGCGDFITDYEGITGYEEYRPDLALAYVPTVDPATGETVTLSIAPYRVRRFQLTTPSHDEVEWLASTMTRISRSYGVRIEPTAEGLLRAW
jgi:poly-gamma-glutamate synthesis protein (capsule biosynthesis protein)